MKEQDHGVKWFNTVFYPARKTGRAVRYEDGILPRLREREITLFTPWGPRYRHVERGTVIQPTDREAALLRFFAKMLIEWRMCMPNKKFRWVFLGADLYGTHINRLPVDVVAAYFESLAGWISRVIPHGAEFKLWSSFDQEIESYREVAKTNFKNYVGAVLFDRAALNAKLLGHGGDARAYLVERIAEALLIEERYHPVKVAAVARHKDDGVDAALPRLYLVPGKLHAPWL